MGQAACSALCCHQPPGIYIEVEKNYEEACSELEGVVRANQNVKLVTNGSQSVYVFNHTFAIVRHGERLDHTGAWHEHPDRPFWPNDPPLTKSGLDNANTMALSLQEVGKTFDLIVSSPYMRCAQTAAKVAQVMHIPVLFDLDLGEIFDDVAMTNISSGRPQHRSPKDLEVALVKDFPNVEFMRTAEKELLIEGTQQRYPESYAAGRLRMFWKVHQLVQRSVDKLTSILIVAHGDALEATVNTLRDNWTIRPLPFLGYALCSKPFDIMVKGKDKKLDVEKPFSPPEEWEVVLSKNIRCIKKSYAEHMPRLPERGAESPKRGVQGRDVDRKVTFNDVNDAKESLSKLGASPEQVDEFASAFQLHACESERPRDNPYTMNTPMTNTLTDVSFQLVACRTTTGGRST
eukprot:TRINITY_DN19264_c1_g3_i1.p1 TRINITY_DN19264_c1_g3~~TRINITY_DN19264_c1_g3_i1.p1  ORF type:complete len:432 (-),score=53.48 TRINITY_DN19264_c1_g3_i1:206-1417(-)